jgi:molybdopterin converting factor small subunit
MAVSKRVNLIVNEQGADKAARGLGRVDKGMATLAKSAAAAAAAFLAAGGIVRGLKEAVSLYGIQEQAEKSLEVALGRTSQALLDQASALQQVSTFGDETIIKAQALIAAFVGDEDQIKAATKATLDLAAAKGMDLVAAADLVSKTLGSSTNALSRYGIQVEGTVGSSERLEALTRGIADAFGGQAAAAADTMAGSIQQAKNAIGDAGESIGRILAPAVIRFAKAAKAAAESIDALSRSGSELEHIFSAEELALEAFRESLRGMNDKELAALADQLQSQIQINAIYNEQAELLKQKLMALAEAMAINADVGERVRHEFEEQNYQIATQIQLLDKLKTPLTDLRTDWQKFTDAGGGAEQTFGRFADNLARAVVDGQNLGDAVVNSLKAIAAQLIAQAALYAILFAITGGTSGAISGGFLPFVTSVFTGNTGAGGGNPVGGTLGRGPTGGGGGDTIVVNVSGIVAGSPEDVGEAVNQYLNAAQAVGRA